jgi:hypothetical protein
MDFDRGIDRANTWQIGEIFSARVQLDGGLRFGCICV